jgi:ferric-dicitrate binding protein FerR (iron transport regulator)
MDMNDEFDIERVLKAAGRREPVPAAIERAAREHLRREWRALVGERQGARRRNTALAMAASMAAAVVGLWLVGSQSSLGAGPVGTVSVAQDDVRVRGGWLKGWEPAAAGLALKAGQSIETGSGGRAGLAVPGIASVRLDHGTRLRLAAADRLVIERGAIYVDAGRERPGESRLLVETPVGIVRHVGTQYEVRVDGPAVRLRVREGRVEWRSRSGAVEHGQAGEQITIAANGDVARQPSPGYGDTWDWIGSTTPAMDIEGLPLAQFLAWAGRELGREVVFATPGVRQEAASIVVHGSVAGLSPREALEAVLATTSVRGALDEGQIVISGGRDR